MKKLPQRNLNELNDKYELIDTINNHNVYIPSSYNNPLSYLKKECPIWIQLDEENNCDVVILDKNNTTDNVKEIKDYIIKNL